MGGKSKGGEFVLLSKLSFFFLGVFGRGEIMDGFHRRKWGKGEGLDYFHFPSFGGSNAGIIWQLGLGGGGCFFPFLSSFPVRNKEKQHQSIKWHH